MEMESGAADIIGNTLEILLKCDKIGEVLCKQAPPSIYMVPSKVRDLSPSSFTPRVVAIGPLHRQDPHLQGFEIHKTTYLHNWLNRLGMAREKTLRECAEKVIGSIERIKACYAGSMTYDDSELAKMMVIDACFILEFVQSLPKGVSSNMLITRSITQDMLLIENQIPFFVLKIISDCTALPSGRMIEGGSLNAHLEILIRHFYFVEEIFVVPDDSAPDHILGLLHKYFRPMEPMSSMSNSNFRKRHTTMELERAGMKFKPNNDDQNWALAMKVELPLPLFPWMHIFMVIPPFSWFQRPTLRMPKVRISDGSELILRNLIVYEQCSDIGKYITAYLSAMNTLIGNPEDVALLVKSKILVSYFGTNEEASDMINNLGKNIVNPKSFYYREWEEMDAYYNSYWPHTLAVLRRTYFNNPWSIIAVIAAFLLFSLTVFQTIFAFKAA